MYSEDVKNLIIDLYDNGPILMSKLGEEKRPIVEEAEKQGLVKIRKMNIQKRYKKDTFRRTQRA